jgi:hypothetical protein
VEFQLGADDDDGAAGIVDALTEEVLAESALLTLESVGEGFEGTVIGAAEDTAAAAVVEQGVDGLLQHALLVPDDDVRGMELDELFEAVVAVDDAAIEVVEVRGGEAAAIERHQRAQFRGDNGEDVQDHPVRTVAGLAKALDNAEALGEFEFFLLGLLGLHALADFEAEGFDVDFLEEFLDAFGAHHGDVLAAELLIEGALAFIGDDFAVVEFFDLALVDDDEGFKIKNAFEVAEGDIEEVADAAGEALEEPNVGAGAGQFDMAEAFAADAGKGDFDAALVADDAAVFHALVLAAEAFPVRGGTEDAGAEKAVAFRFEGTVIDGLRLGNLAVGPTTDLLRRGE